MNGAYGVSGCGQQNWTAGKPLPQTVDTHGNGCVTTTPSAIAATGSATGVSSATLKASAGTFFGAQVNSTASVWVFLFNATALPSNGAVTWGSASGNVVAAWQIQPGGTYSISENPALLLSAGITLGCSSTGPATFTASTACTFGSGQVQ
jgi:hypothetical protein